MSDDFTKHFYVDLRQNRDGSEQVGGNHYRNKAIEPIEYIMKNNLGYCEGNVIKYVTRHAEKGGAEDIRKAIQYLHFILERQYDEAPRGVSLGTAQNNAVLRAYDDCINAITEMMAEPLTKLLPGKSKEGAIAFAEDILAEVKSRRIKAMGVPK